MHFSKLNKKEKKFLYLYCIVDLIAIGVFGMGVPFFCILLGFPLGWVLSLYLYTKEYSSQDIIRTTFHASLVIAGISFIILLIIWAPTWRWLFNPELDIQNFGEPMILFTPLASFIGWQLLMVVISPFLQWMAVITGVYLSLYLRDKNKDSTKSRIKQLLLFGSKS